MATGDTLYRQRDSQKSRLSRISINSSNLPLAVFLTTCSPVQMLERVTGIFPLLS